MPWIKTEPMNEKIKFYMTDARHPEQRAISRV
jgi:hypothetical protein